jgi:hypothetical protein
MRKESWIVICQQFVGNPQDGYGISYEWDGQRFATKAEAVKHGWEIRESDDFNVCSLRGNALTGFYWMDEDMNDSEGMGEICKQHSFTLAFTAPVSGLT